MERLIWRQVSIPKGLSSLLELICTETLRKNPECIYSFIADLLEKEHEAEVERQQQQQRQRSQHEDESGLIGQEVRPDEVTPVSVINISEDVSSSPPLPSGQKLTSSTDDEPVIISSTEIPYPQSPPLPDEIIQISEAPLESTVSPEAVEVPAPAQVPASPPPVQLESPAPPAGETATEPLVEATTVLRTENESVSNPVVKDVTVKLPPAEVQTGLLEETKPKIPDASMSSIPAEATPSVAEAENASPSPAEAMSPPAVELIPSELVNQVPVKEESKPVSPPPAVESGRVASATAESQSLVTESKPESPSATQSISAVKESIDESGPVDANKPVSPPAEVPPLAATKAPVENSSDSKPVAKPRTSTPNTQEKVSESEPAPLIDLSDSDPPKPVESPGIVSFIETSAEPVLGQDSQLSQEEREEIEQLLSQTFDTQEIQDLLQSGEFLSVVEPEKVLTPVKNKEEDDNTEDVPVKGSEQLFQPQREEPEYDDDEEDDDDAEEDSSVLEDDDEEEDLDDNDSEVEKVNNNNLITVRAASAGELSSSDIDPNDAATRIQANFRGYRARKNLQAAKKDRPASGGSQNDTASGHDVTDSDRSSIDLPPAPRRRVGSTRIRSMGKHRSGFVVEDEEALLNYDGDYLNQAATRIQANVRGFLQRKEYQKKVDNIKSKKQAATKIQATVRGFLTRRRLLKGKLANRRRSSHGGTLTIQRRGSLKPDQAATRIQAAFRGYHVRQARSKNPSESREEQSSPKPPASPATITSPSEVAPTP